MSDREWTASLVSKMSDSNIAALHNTVVEENQRLQSILSRLKWTPCSEALPPEWVDVVFTDYRSELRVGWAEDGALTCGDALGTFFENCKWHPCPGTALWESIMEAVDE